MVIGVVRDPSGVWDLLLPRLTRCLPLTHLTWASPTGTYKQIDEVSIRFELEPAPASPDAPFLSMLLFICDHLDSYKRHKALIDGFVSDPFVQGQCWLVAVVSLGTTPGPVRPVRRLIERIESDLSDRIGALQGQAVLIDLADATIQDRGQSDRIAAALKWCVERTAEKRSAEFEYRLRSMQQLGAPLDFSAYFAVKEAYSLFYQNLGLFDDSLRQYDELDALLDTLAISKSMVTLSLEWSLLLLAPDLIALPSPCGPYQYLSYIFSRQIRLLFAMDRVQAACQRTARFIKTIKKFDFELMVWTEQVVCIVLSITQMANNDLAMVELLSLALTSFEQCGLALRLIDFNLQSLAFITMPQSEYGPEDLIDFRKITPDQLRAGFESRDTYRRQYAAFADLVRRAFYDAGRRRFAGSLSYRLGSVLYCQGRVRKALQVFESGTAMTTWAWQYCTFAHLLMTAQCHYLINDIHAYIETAFAVLKCRTQEDAVRRQFRDQFVERMGGESVAMMRRDVQDLAHITSLHLERDQVDLHAACNTDLFCDERCQFEIALDSHLQIDLAMSVTLMLDCTGVSERFELRHITLRPRQNRISFADVRLSVAGDYRPAALQFRIQDLVLESVLDQADHQVIRVRTRSPTASLSLGSVSGPLVLGRTHSIPVTCQSHFDHMTNVQLSVQSISNPYDERLTVVNGETNTTVSSQNGVFSLSDCDPHHRIDLIIDISPPADMALHQDLSLIVTYTLEGVMPVSAQTHTSLTFILPLSLTSSMETVLSRTFIQLVLHCVTDVPVELHSYTFQPGAFSFRDLNPNLVHNLITPFSSGHSFVFEIFDQSGLDPDIDDPGFLESFVFRGCFQVRCQPVGGKLSNFLFPVNIHTPKLNPSYKVLTSCASRATLGEPIPFTIQLQRAPHSAVSTPRAIIHHLVYDLVFDEGLWRYAGKLHGQVSLQNEAVISAAIVPITCGLLPLPSLKLAEIIDGFPAIIDDDQIAMQSETKQVLVLARGRFAAGLVVKSSS